MKSQDRSCGQATDDNDIASVGKAGVCGLHRCVPILPARCRQLCRRTTVPGELWTQDGVTSAGETQGDESQLDWRAAKAMDQKESGASTRQINRSIGDRHPGCPVLSVSACYSCARGQP